MAEEVTLQVPDDYEGVPVTTSPWLTRLLTHVTIFVTKIDTK